MAELGLAVFTATKEVYLLSRFIARTAKSASNHQKERSELDAELEFEQLYIRSFGQLYMQSEGMLTPNDDLNRAWLQKIGDILESLRLACGDYAKLAAEHDDEYRALSPFINPPDHSNRNIVFELPSQVSDGDSQMALLNTTTMAPPATQQQALGASQDVGNSSDGRLHPQKSSDASTKKTNFLHDLDWRWALSEKKKLRRILTQFQEARGKMKDLLQLAIMASPQYVIAQISDLEKVQRPDSKDNLQTLGLRPHVQLRVLELEDNTESKLDVRNGTLRVLPGQNALSMGSYIDQPGDGVAPVNVIAEFKTLDEDSTTSDRENLFHLARLLLASRDSDLKTLPFQCITKYRSDQCYAFLFGFPAKTRESTPASLHDLISPTNARRQNLSLPYRFHIAQSIAKSLAAFHADNWVHKSLRSRSVAFLYAENGILDFTTPYLTSFEYSRSTNTNTNYTYDNDPEKNLYRHPDRQRPPSISFNKLHDLWALGVVLLEIGLWETAASIQHDGVLKRALSIPVDPYALKDIYLDRVAQDLAHNMGPAYAEAVKTCLLGDFGCGASDDGLSLAVHTLVIGRLDINNLFIPATEHGS